MIVSVYAGARANRPAAVEDMTWDELCDELEALVERTPDAPETATPEEQKKCLLAWAPHQLRDGATRAIARVAAVTMLVLDVDHGDPEAVVAELDAASVAAFVYESPSSTPEAPRFRVVVPTTAPIPPDACRTTRIALAEAVGLEPDCGVAECGDATRLFFVGRLHATPPRRTWRVDGAPLDVATLPPVRKAWGAAKPPATALTPLERLPSADAGVAVALGAWQAHAGRKWHVCGAVGGIMRRLAYSRAACEAELRAWLPADEAGVDVDAGVARAVAAWDKPADTVSGHEALAEWLGDEHADVVERAAYAGTWAGRRAATRTPWARPAGTVAAGGADDDRTARVFSAWDRPLEPIEYYCEALRLAPSKGKISLIAGMPSAAKSPMACYLALSFALGGGDFRCQQRNVLVLDSEGERLTQRRIQRMCIANDVARSELRDHLFTYDTSSENLIDDPFYDWLEMFIRDHGIGVIVLDSYTNAMLATGLDSNKPEWATLAKVLGSLGVLVLAVAHANKAPLAGERPTLGQVAGSYALGAAAATGIVMWRPGETKADPEPTHIHVACMRAPESSFAAFDVEFVDTHGGDGLALRVVDQTASAADEARAALVRFNGAANRVLAWMHAHAAGGKPWSQNAIGREAGGVHHRDVARALAAFEAAGFVSTQPKGDKILYTLCGDAPRAIEIDDDGAVK